MLVSHFMDEVEELCDRVAILDRGRIVALDTPTALIDRAGSEQRMRFRPIGVIPAGLIEEVPGVTAVTRSGSQVIVTGTGEFATGVTADLGRAGAGGRPAAGAAHARRRVRRADRPEHGKLRERQTDERAPAGSPDVETKLFFREPRCPRVFGLPVLLVIGFGLIPGFGDPQLDLSGQSGTEYIASIGVAIVLAVLGLSVLPTTLGTYRERGVLRRLRATPVTPADPARRPDAAGAAAAIRDRGAGAGRVARVRRTRAAQPGRLFLLRSCSARRRCSSLGLLVAAVAPTAKAAGSG